MSTISASSTSRTKKMERVRFWLWAPPEQQPEERSILYRSCSISRRRRVFGCTLMPPGVDSHCCWTSFDRSYPASIRPTPSHGTHIRSFPFPWVRGCSLRAPKRTQFGRSELRRVICPTRSKGRSNCVRLGARKEKSEEHTSELQSP